MSDNKSITQHGIGSGSQQFTVTSASQNFDGTDPSLYPQLMRAIDKAFNEKQIPFPGPTDTEDNFLSENQWLYAETPGEQVIILPQRKPMQGINLKILTCRSKIKEFIQMRRRLMIPIKDLAAP